LLDSHPPSTDSGCYPPQEVVKEEKPEEQEDAEQEERSVKEEEEGDLVIQLYQGEIMVFKRVPFCCYTTVLVLSTYTLMLHNRQILFRGKNYIQFKILNSTLYFVWEEGLVG
jgi:hypothetical protein